MGFANEILDAIEIMVKQVVEDNTTKIYIGVCKSISTSTCVLTINGRENTVKYYGGTPTVGTVYQVFIPFGNMSAAFIIVPGGGGEVATGVASVNGKTGNVILNANDVGALPNTTVIPSKTSEIDNDSGFIDAAGASAVAPVQSVNAKTGAVVLTQDDVGNGQTYVRTHNDFTDAVKQQINTNEDNIAMLDSDMEAAQGDITTLKGNVTTLTTALQSKQDKIVGGASTITDDNLTVNRALVSDGNGKVIVSNVTNTELGYLDGVTSNIQAQLNKKLESAPVTSVNTKTGAVVLAATDVGAVSTSDVTTTLGTSTTKVPSEKAVSDAIGEAGGGDMLKVTYDPTGAVATAGGIPDYVTNNAPVISVDDKTGAVTTEAVKYTSQTLTPAQKAQARTNIGAFSPDTQSLDEDTIIWDTYKNRNRQTNLGPIISSLDPAFAGNKFAFCKPGGITIEYSNDSGSTWSAYSATDSQKIALMTQNLTHGFFIGGKLNAKATVDDQLRVTIDAVDCGVYTYLTSIIVDISTNGATGCQCKVEYSVNNAVDTFIEYYTYPISGWTGRNSFPWLPSNISNFGNSVTTSTGMKKLRLTFFCTKVNANYNSNLSVSSIHLIGIQNWKTNSNLAKTGHLYSYDVGGNATFPGEIRTDTALTGKYIYVADSNSGNSIQLSGSTGNIVATGNIRTSTGTVTANKFVGDGSGLTNLPSSAGIKIITSASQPTNMNPGDFWYQEI